MAGDRPRSAEESISADLIEQRGFATAFRGFDTAEVKAFLGQVASEVRFLRQQQADMQAALATAEHRAAHPRLDEETLTAALGEETKAILRAARTAAVDIRAAAEESAVQTAAQRQAQADAICTEAESILSVRTAEADEAAAQIRAEALRETNELREMARREADALRAQAYQERKEMVERAQAHRDKVLGDLGRRRKLAATQIEQLRAGRERLLEAYRVVRLTLDDVTAELQRSEAEARAAAGAAAHRPLPADALIDIVDDPETGPELRHRDEDSFAIDEAATGGSLGGGDEAGTGEGLGRPGEPGETGAPSGEAGRAAAPAAGERSIPPTTEMAASRPPDLVDLREHAAALTVEGAADPDQTDTVTEDPPGSRRRSRAKPDPAATPGRAKTQGAPAGSSRTPARGGEQTPIGSGAPRRRRRAATEAAAVNRPAGDVLVVESSNSSLVAELIEQPAGAHHQSPGGSVSPEPGEDPDDVFARIRADRAQSVAHARDVLAAAAPRADMGEKVGEAGVVPPPGPSVSTSKDVDDLDAPISNADEALLQRRDEAIATIESALARRLKRALQDEQNDLLDRLRGLRGKVTESALLPARDEQAERFAAVSRPLLDEAAQAGASFVRAILPPTAGPPEMVEASEEGFGEMAVLADELAAAVATPLRRRLAQAFADGQNEEPAGLAESLGAAYREWKTQRIERTAGDHVAAAFSRGAYEATPEGTVLRWLVEDLDGPCPDCDDNTLAGSVPRGEVFPTGQLYPPAHPGCRCLLIPG